MMNQPNHPDDPNDSTEDCDRSPAHTHSIIRNETSDGSLACRPRNHLHSKYISTENDNQDADSSTMASSTSQEEKGIGSGGNLRKVKGLNRFSSRENSRSSILGKDISFEHNPQRYCVDIDDEISSTSSDSFDMGDLNANSTRGK